MMSMDPHSSTGRDCFGWAQRPQTSRISIPMAEALQVCGTGEGETGKEVSV
jgi:hypothetical protein